MSDRLIPLGRRLSPLDGRQHGPYRGPDWRQADPDRIRASLERALALPSGGWFAVDASRALGESPKVYRINGRDLVFWRVDGRVLAAPDRCPHMGASLACARVEAGFLVCPWHGLKLGPRGHGAWRPRATHDDGVLFWVRFDSTLNGSESPTAGPILPSRPGAHIDAVIRIEAACEPRDVLANRLDPWHGAHFHPYSFGRLKVIGVDDDALTVRVAFKVLGPLAVEVDCTFHCPEPRTVVMTIIDGEGAGSVVETHATPVDTGRTVILEATLATSERSGFEGARRAARLIRPAMRWMARRLWVDDAAYAERRYALRREG